MPVIETGGDGDFDRFVNRSWTLFRNSNSTCTCDAKAVACEAGLGLDYRPQLGSLVDRVGCVARNSEFSVCPADS